MIIGRCFEYNKNDPEFAIQAYTVLREWEGKMEGSGGLGSI